MVYDVVYDIARFFYDIVRATYDIAEKYTTSYYRFLPVGKNIRHRIFFTGSCQSYVRRRIRHRTFFCQCRILCSMQHLYYTISYVRFLCRWFTSPKTYNIVLRRRMQYRSIQYAIRSIWYVCLGRRQAQWDVLAMTLQLPWPCRMVYIAPAPCRSSFPQSGTLLCGQCEWWLPCVRAKVGTAPDQNSSWFVCM